MKMRRIILLIVSMGLFIPSVLLILTAYTNTKDAKSDNTAQPLKPVAAKIREDDLNGFRNIQWGTDISKINKFKLIRKGKVTMEKFADFIVKAKTNFKAKYIFDVMMRAAALQTDGIWIKNDDNLFLGNIKLENIYYYTINSRLVGVLLTMDSYKYLPSLKSALTKQYGAEDTIKELDNFTKLSRSFVEVGRPRLALS